MDTNLTMDHVQGVNTNQNPSTIIQNPANHVIDDEALQRLKVSESLLYDVEVAEHKSTPAFALVDFTMSPNPEEQKLLENESTNNQGEIPKDNEKKPVPNKKKHGKPKDEVTFRTHLTSLAHVSVLVFVYLILKLATRSEFEFFTWHPILMGIGWMLLMTEGFFAINKYNTYWRLKTTGGLRVKVHVFTLATGYILCIAGFSIAYINKEDKGKSHFVSWHGLFGLVSLIATLPPVINGLSLWYKNELKVSSPRLLKFIHVTSGTVAFTFGALALVLSVYTNWYAKRSNYSVYLFYFGLATVAYPLVWAVLGPSVKLYKVIKDFFSEDKED